MIGQVCFRRRWPLNSRLMQKILVLTLALGIAGCNKKEGAEQNAAAEEIVRIGSVSPLTGPQAHLGKDQENAVRLALEEANARGLVIAGRKVKFQLLSEDDQADPKTATIVAQKLVDQQARGVIGHLNSGTTIPASKIYSDAGIPQISPSATAIPYTAQGFKSAFRIMANDSQQGKALGDYAARTAKKIAIIDDRTAYGQGLADEVEKVARAGGAEIVAHEFTTDKATDFLAILTAIKAKKPELLFYGGMDAQAAPLAKQMKQLGMNARLLGGDGMQTAEFLKLASADAEGMTASSPGLPIGQMQGGKAFVEKFGSRYGKIQLYAPYGYDAATALIEAMRKADSTEPAKYLPELARIRFNGITGEIAFDAKGDILGGAVTLYQVRKGGWEKLEPSVGTAVAQK